MPQEIAGWTMATVYETTRLSGSDASPKVQFTSFGSPQYSASCAIRTCVMMGGVSSERTNQVPVEERPPTECTVTLSSCRPAGSALKLAPEVIELTFWHWALFKQSSYVGIGTLEPSSFASSGSQLRRSWCPAGCTASYLSGSVQSSDTFRLGMPLGLAKKRTTMSGGLRSMATSKGPSSSLSPRRFSARMAKVRASDPLANAMG